MVEIPDSLRSVFSATVHERDGGYIVERGPPEQLFDDPQTDRAREFLSRITGSGPEASD